MSTKAPLIELTEGERAILVSVETDDAIRPYAIEELTALTETAGASVVGEFYQKRDHPDADGYWEAVRWQSDHVERGRELSAPPDDPLTVVTKANVDEFGKNWDKWLAKK